jgi:hypothetical protein
VNEKFPFNGKSALSPKDNSGSIGAVLPVAAKTASPAEDIHWTLYLTLENPSEAELVSRFDKLKAGVRVRE